MNARFVVKDATDAHADGWHGLDCPYGCEKGWTERWELYDVSYAPPRLVGADGGSAEDQLLIRDWSWVSKELNALATEAARLREELERAHHALNTAINDAPESLAQVAEKVYHSIDAALLAAVERAPA